MHSDLVGRAGAMTTRDDDKEHTQVVVSVKDWPDVTFDLGDGPPIGRSPDNGIAPESRPARIKTSRDADSEERADRWFQNETAAVRVTDLRNDTAMSEVPPNREFSESVADWLKDAASIIEQRGGTVDKFVGDGVMACWLI